MFAQPIRSTQRNRAPEHKDRIPFAGNERFVERLYDHAPDPDSFPGIRGEPSGDSVQLRPGLLESDAVLQPSHRKQRSAIFDRA